MNTYKITESLTLKTFPNSNFSMWFRNGKFDSIIVKDDNNSFLTKLLKG